MAFADSQSEGSGGFYITGGTLRPDAPCYVEREADRELREGLLGGAFCHVLTSRQMGKSSLMARVANQLREAGRTVLALDLTALGLNVTPEQWYDGFIERIGAALGIETELDEFWLSHGRLGPAQRLFQALREVVLQARPGACVIFVDEIDTVRSLPFSTDEFFAAVRECYNRRAEDRELERLSFCLLGVATPGELIRDPRNTPFNIGLRIELRDFSLEASKRLAGGLPVSPELGEALVERAFYWTHGHPYLTQRLCRALADRIGAEGRSGSGLAAVPADLVDEVCESVFLTPRAREQDDNLLFTRERMLRAEREPDRVLELYGRIRSGARILDDETNDGINQLRLAGITRVEGNELRVRNRIYARVFDPAWVRSVRGRRSGGVSPDRGGTAGLHPEARQLYLRGKHHLSRCTEEDFNRALDIFEQATVAEPRFSAGYAGLANTFLALIFHGFLPPERGWEQVRSAVEKAVELDPAGVEPCFSAALLELYHERELEKAGEILEGLAAAAPQHVEVREHLALLQAAIGEYETAIATAAAALEIDPVSVSANLTNGTVLLYAGRGDAALEHGWRMLQSDAGSAATHRLLGQAYLECEMAEESLAQFRKAVSVGGGPGELSALGAAQARLGDAEGARAVLEEMLESEKKQWVSPLSFARLHAALGEVDEAIRRVREAIEERHPQAIFLGVAREYDPLRGNPGFGELLERAGLLA